MADRRGLTILHLSDLHLGEHHNFAEGGVASLLERLRQDAERGAALRPDLVVVTGDLTYKAKPSEFMAAERLLAGLVEHFQIGRDQVVVVPGNHDVSWPMCQAYFSECEAAEVEASPPYWTKWKNFIDFIGRFYGDLERPPVFVEGQPWTLFEIPGQAVVVAGLNSTIAETHRDGEHYGFVGEEQLRFFARELASYRAKGYLRVVALHHDVHAPEDERSREDARDLRGILGPLSNLILHGHRHEQQLVWMERDVPVLGIGSAGVRGDKRPEEIPNQYQWLRVFGDRVEFGVRRWVPHQKRWVGETSADPRGEAGWVTQSVAFVDAGTFAAGHSAVPGLVAVGGTGQEEERRSRGLAVYGGWLARASDRLPLGDIARYGDGDGLGVGLRQVYVAPALEFGFPAGDAPGDEAEGPLAEAQQETEPRAPRMASAISPLLAAPRHRWLLVMGQPGAGKSSLLKWICAAPEALAAREDPRRQPVLIDLLAFHEGGVRAGGAYDFFDYLAEVMRRQSAGLDAADLKALAEEGRLYWCFDGLDEIPDERARVSCIDQIHGLAARYGRCRGVVTCRLAAAVSLRAALVPDLLESEPSVLPEEGAGPAKLSPWIFRPFDRPRIDEFLDRWHDHVYAGDPEGRGQRRRRIAAALDKSPSLVELAGTPLLLTFLALLSRGQDLPVQRHALYGEVVGLMAERWEVNKFQRRSDRFSLGDRRAFLRTLAWEMSDHEGGRSPRNVITVDALRRFGARFCRERLGEGEDEADVTVDALLRQLRERDFILARRGDGTFCFVHKAIFEFCVADAIHERFASHKWSIDQICVLTARRWRDESWSEVIFMVGAMLAEGEPRHAVEMMQAAWATENVFTFNRIARPVEWSVRFLAGIENLASRPIQGFKARLSALLDHVGVENAVDDGFDWPSWARVAPDLPDAPKWVGRLMPRARAQFSDRKVLLLAALVGLRGRAKLLRLCERPGGARELSNVLENLLSLAPWTVEERAILQAASVMERDALGLCVLALLGVPEAESRLRGCIEEGDPKALAAVMWMARPVGLYEAACSKMEDLAVADPSRLAKMDPVALAYFPAGEHYSKILDGMEEFLSSHDVTTPEEMSWVEFLLDNGRESLFDRWAATLTTSGPGFFRLMRLQRMCEAGSERAQALQRQLAREAQRYDFEHDGMAVSAFLRQVREPLPTDELLKKLQGRRVHWASVVDALVTREAPTSQAEFEATLTRVEAIGEVDRFSLFQISEVSRPWLRARLTEEAIVDGNFNRLRQLIDEPIGDERVLARLAQLHESDLPKYVGALLTLGHPEKIREEDVALLLQRDDDAAFNASYAIALARGDSETLRRLGERPLPDLTVHDPEDPRFLEARSREQRASGIPWRLALAERVDALLREGRPRRAEVRLRGRVVGHLEEMPDGDTRFTYLAEYAADPGAVPISMTMPVRSSPYEQAKGLHPFFAGLLPEGWLHDQMVRRFMVGPRDEFGLLLATGADMAGAVQVLPIDEGLRARYRRLAS